jgi:hypothetical protein
MLYKDVIVLCSEIHAMHINEVCGQRGMFNATPYGKRSNLRAWKV